MEAESLIELERCSQCGQPRWICQNDDPDIAFAIQVETCNAIRAKERAEKARSKRNKDAEVGVALGIEAYTYSQTPLDDFREPFYEQAQKDREKRASERPVRPREKPL